MGCGSAFAAAARPPTTPASRALRSSPVDSFTPSITWLALVITSLTSFVELPSPYMTMRSVWDSGAAEFLTTSGRALRYISSTDASPIFFWASAFFSMASASAKPLARIPSASCSMAKRWASASALRASAALTAS